MFRRTKRNDTIAYYALLAYTLLLLLPVGYQCTLPYLDSSWGYDLNYFFNSASHFGPDLIFTYGPLGFLDNPQHVGHDIGIAQIVRTIFWLALGWQLACVWRARNKVASVFFCVSLCVSNKLYQDYWDYLLLALMFITVMKLLRASPNYLDLSLIPILMGVGFLLKFTLFAMSAALLGAYLVYLCVQRRLSRKLFAWLCLCFLSGPIAYLIYDHSLHHLEAYVRGTLQISAGFATAMSLDATTRDTRLAAALVLIMFVQGVISYRSKPLLPAGALLLVFMTWSTFRHGFIRGDHSALFFGFSILIFASLFMCGESSRDRYWIGPTIAYLIFTMIAVTGFAERYPVFAASNWWPRQELDEAVSLFHLKLLDQSLDHCGDSLFAVLPGMVFKDAIRDKRVMIFPAATPYVAKIPFEMFPLYALQAYAAYTPYLERRGAETLARANPPVDKVLIEWVDIDGRNLILDSPAMTMTLLSNYEPEGQAPSALLLKRRSLPMPITLRPIVNEPFEPGSWAPIPHREQLVAVSIRLRPTFAGRLLIDLYRLEPIFIEVRTDSGSIDRFRIPPEMLESPTLINYIPESINGLECLWGKEPLQNRNVQVRLSGPGLRWLRGPGYRFYAVNYAGAKFAR